MTNSQNNRTIRISLRVSDAEHAWLKELAGKQSVSSVIRSRLFSESDLEQKQVFSHRPRNVIADKKLLAQILGLLGRNDAFQNLQDIAEACRAGRPISPVISIQIISQCSSDLVEIKSLLMKALGIAEE